MRRVALAVMAVMLVTVPLAGAADPLVDPTCVDASNCVGPGTCVPTVACVPRACTPIVHCRSELSSRDCEINATIQGQTCQVVAGLGLRAAGGQSVDARVVLTDGNVDAFHLPNSWITPSAELSGSTGDLDSGSISAGVYTSAIFTPGPSSSPTTIFTPEDKHRWDHVAVLVHMGDGATNGESLIVDVWTLDLVPEDCYVRTSAATIFDCRDVLETLS